MALDANSFMIYEILMTLRNFPTTKKNWLSANLAIINIKEKDFQFFKK